MTPLQELLKEKTKEDFFDELVQACVDEKLSTTAWQPGEPMRAVMVVVARVLAWLWSLVALPALRAAFLDYAEGTWLTLYAWTFYNVKRHGVSFASQSITVENRGPFAGPIAIGSIRVKNGTTGKTFTNTTGTSFLAAWSGSGAYPTVSLVFTADEAGTASDTPSGYIATQPITAPSGVVVQTNAVALLGSDTEEDEDLRERCRTSKSVLSPAGPADAYRFLAMSTIRADGSLVPVNRVRVLSWPEYSNTVEVVLASRSGPTTGNMATVGTDVFEVYANLLKNALPAGMVLLVHGAEPVPLSIRFRVYKDAKLGLSVDETHDAFYASAVKSLSEFPIGGWHEKPVLSWNDTGKIYTDKIIADAYSKVPGVIYAKCYNEITFDPLPFVSIGAREIPFFTVVVEVILVEQP